MGDLIRRKACAQPALEMWQQYTPAPTDHPAIMQHGVLVDDARVIPAGTDMPFPDDGIDWLALPLTNPKGDMVSLAYLHPEPNQKPRYFDGYAKGAYAPIKPQRGQVVHVVSNPQDGRMLWLAGVAAVVCFTPDDWSTPNLPNPFGDSEPYQPKGGNMAHVARDWMKAGYQVAVPVTPDRVSYYSELLSDTGAVILPIPEPLTWLEVHELGELPQQLADLIKAALQTTADTWGEPLPLGGVEPPAPVYPVEAFPAIARDAIQAIAWHVQAPMGLAGQCVLGTMAYIAQIHVNAPDLHKPEGMPCSLFILTEGASGDRKSACHDLADKVIKERERLMLEEYAEDMRIYHAQLNDPECKDNPTEPRNPKAIFTDATIESIVCAFVESGVINGAWISDEGGHFFGGATMKGDTMKNALSVLVKFFDKGMADRFRSKSNTNGSGTVYDVRLMFNLLGQREVLREALTDPLLRGQGFLPRFIFAAPQSLAGDRPLTRERMRSKSYADARLQRFWEHYGNLLPDPAMPVGDITNLAAYDGVLVRPVLELDDAAADVWLEFYNHTERLQKAESKYEYMRPFAGRAGELARRVAAVFACFEQKDLIDEAAMRGACAVVQYSLDEWLRYADAAQVSVADQQAQRLEIWLISECKKQGVTSLARAHVMQFCPMTALRKAKALNAALKLLGDAHRVRSEVLGRKQMIAVNPDLFR